MGSAESRDHCGLGFEILSAEEELWRDSMFDGVEWWRFQELEIPEEDEDRTKDPTNSSSRSFLTSPNDSSSLSSSVGSGESCRDELQSLPVPTPQALEVPSPAQEWLCEHPNCGRSFTHRYRLKYVSSQPNDA